MPIFSSAKYCLQVAPRMSFTIRSEDILAVADFAHLHSSMVMASDRNNAAMTHFMSHHK
jgi:hypothetical protein